MSSTDFTTGPIAREALILTFSPREKEAERAPMQNRYTRYDACSSLPLGETLAQAAVRVQEWVAERVRVRAVRGV
jgi:hypothetical protein